MDEWLRLIQDHPTVAFNYKNFNGSINSPENGFKVLYQGEPLIGMQENWDLGILRKYRSVVTWNPKFYMNYRHLLPDLRLVNGCLGCNAPEPLADPVPLSKKTNGVCILNHLRHTGLPGDIYWLRNETIQNLNPKLARHVWCTKKWGGDCYQGAVEAPYHHSHINHLKKIAEYKFCLAFESSFHYFWSSGFVTERVVNCFRAGTVPIYIGAYDPSPYIPMDLIIDFRQFWPKLGVPRDYRALNTLLLNFSDTQYEDMVGRAHEWVKTCRLGNIEDLETLLRKIE